MKYEIWSFCRVFCSLPVFPLAGKIVFAMAHPDPATNNPSMQLLVLMMICTL